MSTQYPTTSSTGARVIERLDSARYPTTRTPDPDSQEEAVGQSPAEAQIRLLRLDGRFVISIPVCCSSPAPRLPCGGTKSRSPRASTISPETIGQSGTVRPGARRSQRGSRSVPPPPWGATVLPRSARERFPLFSSGFDGSRSTPRGHVQAPRPEALEVDGHEAKAERLDRRDDLLAHIRFGEPSGRSATGTSMRATSP